MFTKALLGLLVASLGTAAPQALPAGWQVGQEVVTTSGRATGHAAPWPAGGEVSEYLGIPYAVPPVGNLRFAPPQAYRSNDPVAADKFMPDCVQGGSSAAMANASSMTAGMSANPQLALYSSGMGGGEPLGSHKYDEDCLGVNVWTKPQTGEKSKAVMLWIFGGGYFAGTSNAAYYNGARLANDEDVVVVSFNYRTNIFGFPVAPGTEETGNPGLLDQRLAVEWVRDNIANFGGDPKRITLFGESAGGWSVDYYSFAWTEDPIVNAFIAQSGTALGGMPAPRGGAQSAWWTVSKTLGCGGAEAGTQSLDCMRTKDKDAIIDAAMGGGAMGFGPIPDGKTLFADEKARGDKGQFIHRPLLVGHNDNEAGIILGLAGALGGSSSPSPAPGAASNSSNPLAGITDALGGLASAIGGAIAPLMNSLQSSLISVGSDFAFGCPSAASANARYKNNVPVWRYRYMAVWDNLALAPNIGAYHSSEVPLVFGATEVGKGKKPSTEEEKKLESFMMKAWASFAKDPDHGLLGLGWPQYDPNKETLNRIGFQNSSTPNFVKGDQYDGTCNGMNNLPQMP